VFVTFVPAVRDRLWPKANSASRLGALRDAEMAFGHDKGYLNERQIFYKKALIKNVKRILKQNNHHLVRPLKDWMVG
jgi:hypothetical protein